MKKNITVKIVAFLALFGIIISVVGTGILIFFADDSIPIQESTLTPEDLQKIIESQEANTGTGNTGSGIELK